MNIINNLKTLVILSCLYGTTILAIISRYPARVSLEVKAFSVKVTLTRFSLTDNSHLSQCIIDQKLSEDEMYASRRNI